MTVDRDRYIYITGSTRLDDFPVTAGAFDISFNDTNGESDTFVAKLDPEGNIVWATYPGMPSRDVVYTIKVDAEGAMSIWRAQGRWRPYCNSRPGWQCVCFRSGPLGIFPA